MNFKIVVRIKDSKNFQSQSAFSLIFIKQETFMYLIQWLMVIITDKQQHQE